MQIRDIALGCAVFSGALIVTIVHNRAHVERAPVEQAGDALHRPAAAPSSSQGGAAKLPDRLPGIAVVSDADHGWGPIRATDR